MLARLSFNQKRPELSINHHYQNSNNSQNFNHQNEKQNNQNHKNLNSRLGKRATRLSQLDNCLVVKHIEKEQPTGVSSRNYRSNADLKLNLNSSISGTINTADLPAVEKKQFNKLSSRHHYGQYGHVVSQSLNPLEKGLGLEVTKPQAYQSSSGMAPSIPSPSAEKPADKTVSKSNSETFCDLYAERILSECQSLTEDKESILQNHEVTTLLRARMLDWMVEVMRSYKFMDKTYFAGVDLLDRFFKESSISVPVSKLHISGVTAMFIATKMEEVYPLKIKTVYEKIVHKKIDRDSLVDMEMQMFDVLNHKVNSWTFFDLAMLKISRNERLLFNDIVTSDSQKQAFLRKIQQIISFTSKCIIYDYDLYVKQDINTLANTVVEIAWKICKIPNSLSCFYQSQMMSESTIQDIQRCREQVINSYSNFKQNFKGLGNIFKFTDESTISLLNMYCFEEKK